MEVEVKTDGYYLCGTCFKLSKPCLCYFNYNVRFYICVECAKKLRAKTIAALKRRG